MKKFNEYNASYKPNLKFESKVVHGSEGTEKTTGAISFPIYQTATFEHKNVEDKTGYNYCRCINPTREELEKTMCILENGTRAFAVSSGMAAITLAFSVLKPNDHLIMSDDIYGGTSRAVTDVLVPNGVTYDSIELSDLDLLKSKINPNTKMIFIETPTNPMMRIADIEEISKIAHENNILVVVDNTFLTPYYQKPLLLGADMVVHSGTKYLAGHNDVLSGVLVVKDEALSEKLEIQTYINGAALSPLDSWLLIRGIKTLALRMDKHSQNAKKVFDFLKSHKKVQKVFYVGDTNHKDADIIAKQNTGHGGMISIQLDSLETVNKLLEGLNLIIFAESLGGVESLITHPSSRTHTEIDEAKKQALGLTDSLVRLSVGIEDADDIIEDLRQALN